MWIQRRVQEPRLFSGPGFSSFSGRVYLLFQRKRHTGVAHMQTFCVSDQIHVQYWCRFYAILFLRGGGVDEFWKWVVFCDWRLLSAGEKFGMHWDAHCVG